jgi:hypothetical protein
MTRGSSGRDTVWYVCYYLDIRYAYVSTGRTDVIKRGRFWLGVDQRGYRSFKGVDCDILTQRLIGLIKYSYH